MRSCRKQQYGVRQAESYRGQVIEARAAAFQGFSWQAPTLSFAGQAFLLTVMVNPNLTAYARFAASLLGFVIGLAVLQLYIRNTHYERVHREWVNSRLRTHWHTLEDEVSSTIVREGPILGWFAKPTIPKTWAAPLRDSLFNAPPAPLAGLNRGRGARPPYERREGISVKARQIWIVALGAIVVVDLLFVTTTFLDLLRSQSSPVVLQLVSTAWPAP